MNSFYQPMNHFHFEDLQNTTPQDAAGATRPCPPRPLKCICRNVSFLYATNADGETLDISPMVRQITFPTIVAINGNKITYTEGSQTIFLRAAGLYEVMYNITYSLSVSPPTNETIHTFLTLNNKEIIGGNLTSTLANGTTIAHSASTLLIVNPNTPIPSSLRLNVGPITNQTTFENAAISVLKLC